MADIPSKSELIDLIRRERVAWESLIAEVGEARLEAPGAAGDWSMKDVLAHSTAWRNRALTRLQAAQRDEAPPPPPWAAVVDPASNDFEPINQWIYEQSRDRSLDDVLRESRESLANLEAAVEALSERDLTDPQRFAWLRGSALSESIRGSSPDHLFTEHEPVIRAWLSAQTADAAHQHGA